MFNARRSASENGGPSLNSSLPEDDGFASVTEVRGRWWRFSLLISVGEFFAASSPLAF
jgi:hypothetical protein